MICTPEVLASESACLSCLTDDQVDAAFVGVLCEASLELEPFASRNLLDDTGKYITDESGQRIQIPI